MHLFDLINNFSLNNIDSLDLMDIIEISWDFEHC